jgi:hypothetical protein
MSVFSRISPLVWLIAPACACGFVVWASHGRMQRVEYVSGLAGRAAPVDAVDAASPTGYANGQRELIVPERNETSFGWLAQTQQMFARKEWRVRHVDNDNAPFGREVLATSPYRWWLGFVAWVDHTVSRRPIGLSVERAALFADPLLHGLVLIGATAFVAWRFGAFAAGLLSLGLAATFPFAAGFLPGVPDHHGLARICALGSMLVLLAGMRDRWRAGRWFALAGIMGGLGMWVDVPSLVPIIAGIFAGALIAAWIARSKAAGSPAGDAQAPPWRAWALGGGATVLATYLLEFFPGHLGSWNLESVHPLYGLAWIGGGELLDRAVAWIHRGKISAGFSSIMVGVLAAAAVVAMPVVIWKTGGRGFLARDLLSVRLTSQPDGVVSASLLAWLVRDGMSATVLATLVPLLVLVPAGWRLLRRGPNLESRLLPAVALGPVLVALGFACWQLSWWHLLDGALLVLMVAAVAGGEPAVSRSTRWRWSVLTALIVLPGLIQLLPGKPADKRMILTPSEAQELIERHLAHWLASHAEEPGAVVYAPPHETTTLCYCGGLRGIGTFAAENRAGFGATLMIAGLNTMEEVQALIQLREIRYIIVFSWDSFFDDFANLYLDKRFAGRTSFLIGGLRRWNLPVWLRPLPYQMPEISGFEGQSALVFEVVDDQSPAVATSRLAEYLIETGRLDQAVVVGEELRRFPGDVGALAARAQVQSARSDAAGLAQTIDLVRARLANGADRFLPWDRRVSLAIVLTQGGQIEPAREQLRRCLTELDEKRLRFLTTGSLYNLQLLSRALDLPIADPRLRKLAVELLPAELSGRL